MNKIKLLEIAHALDLGSIDDKKARTLLLGLLGVDQPFYCLDEITTPDEGACKKQCEFCIREGVMQ